MTDTFRRYLLPGFVFQSVVIAGGYGTGRELVEIFLSAGPGWGLLAMAVSTATWSGVAMASFDLARSFGVYDYRSFFHRLPDPGCIVYEICRVLILLVVLAVVAAAAGAIGRDVFGLPHWIGAGGVMAAVGGPGLRWDRGRGALPGRLVVPALRRLRGLLRLVPGPVRSQPGRVGRGHRRRFRRLRHRHHPPPCSSRYVTTSAAGRA